MAYSRSGKEFHLVLPLLSAMSHTLYALWLPIERWFDDACRDVFATDFDQDGGAGLRIAQRHIAQPDALL